MYAHQSCPFFTIQNGAHWDESCVNLPYTSVVVINDACNQSTNTIQLFLFLFSSFFFHGENKGFWRELCCCFFFFIWIMFSIANGYLFNAKKGNWKLKKLFCFKTHCFSMPFRGWWIISFTIGFSQPKENNISDIFRSIRYTLSLYTLLHEIFKFKFFFRLVLISDVPIFYICSVCETDRMILLVKFYLFLILGFSV